MGELDRNFITCKFQEKVKKVIMQISRKRESIIAKLKKKGLLTMQTSSGEELNIIGERCIAELLLIAVKKFEFSLSLSLTLVGGVPRAAGSEFDRKT